MRAITQTGFGDASVLQISTLPQPIPDDEYILVNVKAFALNRADLLQRKGKYPPPPGETDILGLEIAGEIVAMGKAVTGFGIGERIFGLVGSGAYAEFCLIHQSMAMPIPENLSYIEAAAIPEAFLTAQEALFTLGNLKPHEKVLIHAGGSGVGSAAIQLAKQVNAEIFATTGTADKIPKITALGAKHVINYKKDNFAEIILEFTDGEGVNVIIDFVGAKYFAEHLRILQPWGRLVLVGSMGGSETEINLRTLQSKRLQIKGLAMRSRPLTEKANFTAQFQQEWLPLFSQNQLKPIIDSVFKFDEIQKAHQYMEENRNFGKIVISDL